MKIRLAAKTALCAATIIHSATAAVAQWEDVPLAHADGRVTAMLPTGASALRARFRMGDRAPANIIIRKAGGAEKSIGLQNGDDQYTSKRKVDDKTVSETINLPDAFVRFQPLVTRHVRPRLRRYTDEQQEKLAERWEQLTPASRHVFTFELRRNEGSFGIYIDGQYAGSEGGIFEGLTFRLSSSGEVLSATAGTPPGDSRYLPMDMHWIARPGSFSNAVLSMAPGLQIVEGVPLVVATGKESGDVGQVRQMKGSWALECDEQLARTALDGMQETLHFAVPAAYYTRAWVLCAVDPDPARDPVVTVRMTRYATSGRGDAIGLDTVWLPRNADKPLPEGVRRAGTVARDGTNLPLFLVEMDLQPGAITDLLAMETDRNASMMADPYLDIDFMGKPGSISAQWDSSRKPDKNSTSGVHLFGVTLERMPVSLRFEQAQPGNIFHNDERPETFVRLRSETAPADGELRWTISDAAGQVIRTERRDFAFEAVGAGQRITVPLAAGAPGWYGLRFELAAPDGRVWLTHEASFALLVEDTRQAGYESPFGTWWFGGAHYSGGELEIAGPMLFKAGFRKTTFGWTQLSEKDFEPWKVTLNQIGWSVRPASITNRELAYAEMDQKVGAVVERFPHCNAATLFHESYNSRIPPELIGKETVETPEEIAKARQMAELGNFTAQYFRDKYPHIKLLVGNTTHSASIISALLRHGMKPGYIDAIGMETVGQTSMPEKLWAGGLQGIWLGREAARRLGHDLPVNGCYEFTSRTERTLGLRRQAEFYTRDVLISLAYGFERVSPGIIMDAGNAYYNSLWGPGGLCRRYPLLYPKQSYVALATLTRVLDRATFVRQLETGSATVYALAFRRADGREVTVLWTTVGEAGAQVVFEKRGPVATVECLGASRSRRVRRLNVTITTSPLYLVGSHPATTVNLRRRRYAPPPATFEVADAVAATNRWELAPGDESMNKHNPEMPFRERGTFSLREVNDDEKGTCLEVALEKAGEVEALISEYTFLKAAEPIAAAGQPTDIGLWVKGDSGWGKIVFEIEDAAGKVWRTEGTWHDWPGDLSINFDGWRFLRYPIDGSSTEPNISPSARWGGASGTPVFPIRLRGIYVVVNRQALGLTEMREAPAVLRLSDIGFIH